jgi:putative protease
MERLILLATVFGWPALFTSRLGVKPKEGSAIWGSNKNTLQHSRQAEITSVRSHRPLCLFEHLLELGKMGVRDFVLDLRGQKLQIHELNKIMNGVERQMCPQPHSTFNYLRKLM